MESIHLLMASDDNYAQHMGVAIVSILKNKKNNHSIIFHILDGGISEINKNKIKKIIEDGNQKICFYKIEDEKINSFPEIGYLSKATYYRLLITEILPDTINKVLYIDCDIVVLNDLYNLYNHDLNNRPIAAVKDIKSEEILRIYFYPKLLNSYFNAGVLLINLKYWRQNNVLPKFIDFINKYHAQLIAPDQDILNCIFKNNWIELEPKFNVDLKHESHNAMPKKNTVILHYSDKIKPWSYLYYGKNKKYYFDYLAISPWSNFKYPNKNLKNIIKKPKLIIIKYLKNKIRPITPIKILDIYKRYMLTTIKRSSK